MKEIADCQLPIADLASLDRRRGAKTMPNAEFRIDDLGEPTGQMRIVGQARDKNQPAASARVGGDGAIIQA